MVSEIQTIDFRGDQLACVLKDGVPHVSVRHVCESLGVSFPTQMQKLKAARWGGVSMIETPDPAGVVQSYAMIPTRSLAMWMATINPRKVADAVRSKLERYQLEAADVLDRYFRKGERFGDPEYDQGDETSVLLAKMLEARTQTLALKRQQAALERQQAVLEIRQAEDRARINAIAESAHSAEDKAQKALDHVTHSTGVCSIKGWANILGIKLRRGMDSVLGKTASQRCRLQGLSPAKVHSEMWGEVNVYPIEILEGMRGEFADRAEPLRLKAVAMISPEVDAR